MEQFTGKIIFLTVITETYFLLFSNSFRVSRQ